MIGICFYSILLVLLLAATIVIIISVIDVGRAALALGGL